MDLIVGQTVIVMDVSNYISEYTNEDIVPFKAIVEAVYPPTDIVVTSDASGKKYSLYVHQILEGFRDQDIRDMVSVEKWYTDGGETYQTENIRKVRRSE